ncbi:MAG: UDP-N-acetylmuramoyl-tripeptide--D-alanyl-D-alanine ligase [Elusimicrobia bacterium]|nr:UDP-N-acetylmuramoyl-tripeptide--D-alanyl-D-alanine ligase [Elusimicrobiota bacterium]
MQALTLSEIVKATEGTLILGDPEVKIGESKIQNKMNDLRTSGVSIDTRHLKPGDIFFALKGTRDDGHAFIKDAAKKGAKLCMIETIPQDLSFYLTNFPAIIQVPDTKKSLKRLAQYYRKKVGSQTKIISINGSCGKTTVKEMTAQILKNFAPTVWSPGNFNNEIGCPLSIFLLNQKHLFGVFEIGSSAVGEVETLSKIVCPDLSILTQIGLEHTATFGNLENIAGGESEVFSYLAPSGIAVLPRDDAYFELLKTKVPKECEIKTFGFSQDSTCSIQNYTTSQEGAQFRLNFMEEKFKHLKNLDFKIPLMGKINVLNACASITACLSLNVPPDSIQKSLKNFMPPDMRFQKIQLKDGTVLINDSYNSNPSSLKSSLECFMESFSGKKKVAVLGDMLELGKISKEEHFKIGQFLKSCGFEKILLTGKESYEIVRGYKENNPNQNKMLHCENKNSLFLETKKTLGKNHAILFKASRSIHLEEVIEEIIKTA